MIRIKAKRARDLLLGRIDQRVQGQKERMMNQVLMLTSPHEELTTPKRGSQRKTPMMKIMRSSGERSLRHGRAWRV